MNTTKAQRESAIQKASEQAKRGIKVRRNQPPTCNCSGICEGQAGKACAQRGGEFR